MGRLAYFLGLMGLSVVYKLEQVQTDMHYYKWKPIGAEQAQRALNNGGSIWKLPMQFGNGAAQFSYALETKRGACYVISNRVFSILSVPETAWAYSKQQATGSSVRPKGALI